MSVNSLSRMIVCISVAAMSILKGFEMINDVSIINQTYSLILLGLGFVLLIYAFSPSMAKQVIKAIVDIIRIPFKAIFK